MGRPNVGKSAMFNRICGKQMAIVYDQPGVTRDRMYTRAFWGDKEFVVVDTGEHAVALHIFLSPLLPPPPHTSRCFPNPQLSGRRLPLLLLNPGGLLSRAQDLPTEVIKVQPDLLTEKDLPDSIEW